MKYSISRDANGNKVCKVKPKQGRGFSIQTNGNLPGTHRNGICAATQCEVAEYVASYGTERQRFAMGKGAK